MVRDYKKPAGSRNYRNYTEANLEEALEKITDGALSINAAALAYKIPFGTLYNRYKGLHGLTPGGQTAFTYAEEAAILKSAATCADWGFPLTTLDLRMFAKFYLDQQGKVIPKFGNNLPGIDWALSVLKRHKNGYGQRLATNIKRAAVSRENLNTYFDNLQREVADIPASNIFNYDESNLSDDPGKKKCIYRRGVKYPEKVMNHSKSCTSVMICGSADGTLLPPYVIYKSQHLYDTWKERGIVGYPCCDKPCCSRGSRYNRTASGWIDASTFRDWFFTCFLPHADRLEGRKVLIGDNLSSHLDTDVLENCASNNISFICLVPNSTHLCQPLDVGFFRPMKIAWRQTIENWKKTNIRAATIPKDTFPKLLREAIVAMNNKQSPKSATDDQNPSAIKKNLISSFEATGIFPFNRNNVLKKIPDEDSTEMSTENQVRDSLTCFLKEQRFGDSIEPSKKKKRLQVDPGKSISTVEDKNCDNQDNDDSQNEPINEKVLLEKDLNQPGSSKVECIQDINDTDDLTDCEEETSVVVGPEVGKFVLARFSSTKGKKSYQYVCLIEDICEGKIVVLGFKSIKKNKTIFRAVENDVSIIEENDIITYLPIPKLEKSFYIFPTEVNIKEM